MSIFCMWDKCVFMAKGTSLKFTLKIFTRHLQVLKVTYSVLEDITPTILLSNMKEV